MCDEHKSTRLNSITKIRKMFDSLKRMAMQKLAEKMISNSLGAEATSAAAEQGAGAVLESIKAKLGAGGIDQVKDLFSGGSMESNELFQDAKSKLSNILQEKGMNAEEANAEAERTAPDLINGLKEKFQSTDEADSEFDLENLTKLIPGNAGDLLNTAKKLFG